MGTSGTVGLPVILVLLTSLFIAGTVATALLDTGIPMDFSDADDYAEDAVNELTRYLQVKQIAGYYPSNQRDASLEKIALLISPLFSGNIDLSLLTIELQTSDDLFTYVSDGFVEHIGGNGVFSHPIWDQNPDTSTFSCLVTTDQDDSITDFLTLNDQQDHTYLIFTLPDSFSLNKGSTFTISLYPGTGVKRSFQLEAPLPTNHVVVLY